MANWQATDARGRNFKSKKALKEAVEAGQEVYLTDTSAFNPQGTKAFAEVAANGSRGDVVVGPCAYTDRRWYASVKLKKDGTPTVT